MKMMMSLLPPSESLVPVGAQSSYVGGVASLTIQNTSRRDEGVCSHGRAESSAGVQVKGQRSFRLIDCFTLTLYHWLSDFFCSDPSYRHLFVIIKAIRKPDHLK